jgi:hypothetical protein
MQILRSHPRPIESKILRVVPEILTLIRLFPLILCILKFKNHSNNRLNVAVYVNPLTAMLGNHITE